MGLSVYLGPPPSGRGGRSAEAGPPDVAPTPGSASLRGGCGEKPPETDADKGRQAAAVRPPNPCPASQGEPRCRSEQAF